MAALHMPYTVPPRPANGPGGMVGCRAAMEEMFRIQPAACARMPGRTSFARMERRLDLDVEHQCVLLGGEVLDLCEVGPRPRC